MRRRPLLFLGLLAGCEALPPAESARLPPGSVEGAGDPTRAAVSRAAFFFSRWPGQRDPGLAARAIADMEFLAASLPTDPRYSGDGLLPVRLRQARAEWRGALGITPEMLAQAVINRMWRIHEGAPDPEMEGRLAALPALPRTAEAASAAARVQSMPDTSRMRLRL